MAYRPPHARFEQVGDALALISSYDSVVVSEIKALPSSERRWDNDNKRWLIASKHGKKIADAVQKYMGISITIPTTTQAATLPDIRTVLLEYLGACKDKPEGKVARGWYNGGWNLIFPEKVLRKWFKDMSLDEGEAPAPDKPKTLYAILGLDRTCDQDAIKPAYRRMALHTHPDRNKEPDAAEQFRRVQAAYDVLSDIIKRRKYDIGLFLELQQEQQQERKERHAQHYAYEIEYRAPLRCGLLIVKGRQQVAGFMVDEIMQWADATNNEGKIMISSWPQGAEKFEVAWV